MSFPGKIIVAMMLVVGLLFCAFAILTQYLAGPALAAGCFLCLLLIAAVIYFGMNKLLRHTASEMRETVELTVEERTSEMRKLTDYIKQIIESKTDIFLLFDGDMNAVHCSDSVIRLMELNGVEDFIGNSIDYLHRLLPDAAYVKRSLQRFARIKFGEESISVDDHINWRDAGTRSYHITYRRLSEGGAFCGVVLTLQDITELKSMESQRRMNDVLYSTLTPCLIWDENGGAVAYNREIARSLGVSDDLRPEEFNRHFILLQPRYQPDGTPTEKIMRGVINDAISKGFAKCRVQLRRSDGAPMQFEVSAARLSWLSGYRLVAYFYDLSGIIAMEAEAKEADERMRVMLDSTPMICVLQDDERKVIDCNKVAMDIFGVGNKADFIRDFIGLYPEYQPDGSRSAAKVDEIWQKVLEFGNINNFEWMFMTTEGDPLPVETSFVRIQWKDTYRVLSYSRDLREVKAREQKMQEITEREHRAEIQREAAQAASEAKSQFLASMSHEIRTPMNAVLGMSELLSQEKLNQRQLRYVKDIKTAATALLDIINDILDISKIQAGKLSINPENYDFNAMMDNISSIAQFLVEDKRIAFRLSIDGDIPECLYGDDNRLRQVLLNLISNAMKFTSEGYVRLSVRSDGETIRYAVSDTGIGIRENDIDKLFIEFEQFDRKKNRGKQGTGLGLSISKALTELMGGHISVESEYGKGSTFSLEFPLVKGDAALIRKADENEAMFSAPDLRVLVVDDSKMNLNVACGLLRSYKISADTAESGEEAVEMVKRKQYDIIFMDHMMPGMDGIETTRAIRDMGVDVIIIAFTASVIGDAMESMLEAGMDDYLSKPVIKKELATVLRHWIPAGKCIDLSDDGDSRGDIPEAYREFGKALMKIKGLSVKEGLDIVSGQWDVYEGSLRLLLDEIEKCDRNLNSFILAGDMRGFAIEAHGIRGSLANIGGTALSGQARELEMASKNEDAVFCSSYLPLFLKNLNDFSLELREAYKNVKHDRSPVDIPAELPGIFDNLKEAFGNADIAAIYDEIEAMKALELTGALKEGAGLIDDAVMVMHYDNAVEIMDRLLKGVNADGK